LRETHEIAQAQQQKNARLREAFGISDYFVEGTSFDPERKAREELAKSEALQKEIQAEKDSDKMQRKKYALVRTPSPDKSDSQEAEGGKVDKKKKKKRNRDA
jgi:serine/arginine repetitive matrix protein 2